MISIIPVVWNDTTAQLITDKGSLNVMGIEEAHYVKVEHPNAGWVICSTMWDNMYSNESTTFFTTDEKFEYNGTGQEMLFESQQLAIRYILSEGLRNCWTVWKMC